MEFQQALALVITVAVFAASLRIHRAVAALSGALILAAVWGIPRVVGSLIPEVLLVTAALMVLSGYVKKSGIASWLALKATKAARGRPRTILVLGGLLSFAVSAVLGPAAVLLVPVFVLLAVELDVPPLGFIVVLCWTGLWGGATALTAQPGNLWVASLLHLGPGTWLIKILPYTGLALVLTLGTALVLFGKSLRVTNERRARILEFDERQSLPAPGLVVKTVVILVLVAAGFVAGAWLPVSPALVAVSGVALLWLWDSSRGDAILGEIGAGTLVFFGGAMALGGVLVYSGIPQWAGSLNSPWAALGVSAVLGALGDHGAVAGLLTPFAAPFWHLLVLGTTLGAGASVLGAASNAVALDMVGSGPLRPSWGQFTRYGLVITLVNAVGIGALILVLG